MSITGFLLASLSAQIPNPTSQPPVADTGPGQKAEQQQAELRRQLLEQFNTILQTTETAGGLIVNMSDVLFDTARYPLIPGAREKLAKISGIILGHPGLKIEVDGYTDSVGGDDYNLKLSENRADGGPRFSRRAGHLAR